MIRSAAHSQAVEAIAFGGLTAGLLDGTDAMVFYRFYAGITPVRLFQHIASGLIGARANNGGWSITILGIALHFTIALGAAAVYYAAGRAFPLLLQKPFLTGPAFGIAVYLVMHYVVVPLSAVTPKRADGMPTPAIVDELFSHIFFVGLPIALIARWAAHQRESTPLARSPNP